jgi:hypothetical protein
VQREFSAHPRDIPTPHHKLIWGRINLTAPGEALHACPELVRLRRDLPAYGGRSRRAADRQDLKPLIAFANA